MAGFVVFKSDPAHYNLDALTRPMFYYIVKSHLAIIEEQNPIAVFSYALKTPETKRQYPRRFKMFVDFLKIRTI